MELRHLRYFIAVSEELHFGRAARRLHISQPPLSQQIRQLEDELGVRLFYRTKHRVEISDAGRVFAGEAHLVLQQAALAAKLAREADRQELNRLTVACSPANGNLVLKSIRAFAGQFPKVQILLKSLTTPNQVDLLRTGLIDVGFLTLPVDELGLEVETIVRESLVIAMAKNHPLSKHRRITLRALQNETMVIFPLHLSPARYDRTAEMCRRAGFSLHAVHEADNIYTMLEIVSAGLGVAIMRASIRDVERKGCVFRDLVNSPVVETGVAHRRGNRLEILHRFIEIARKATRPVLPAVCSQH